VRFLVGLTEVTLDVWPAAGHARVTTEDFQIDAYRVRPAVLDCGRVVFEGNEEASARRVWLDSSGSVTLFIPPSSELGAPADAFLAAAAAATPLQEAQNKPDGPPGSMRRLHPAAADLGALGAATDTTGEQFAAEQRKEYIKLSGRVGRAPVFWTSRNGVAIAKFPLAIHFEDGHTDWHTVKAWRALAGKVRSLEKGQLVSVRGYLDYEVRRSDDGKARRERIVRAAAIIPK
jgi:hypothetical protein